MPERDFDAFVPDRPIPTQGSITVRVRYAECDRMGVAHHAVYPVWLEAARTEVLRDGGVAYRELEDAGVFLVVANLELNYKAPVKYDDLVEVRCRVSGGSRVKLEHEYEIRRDGMLLTTARSVLVCVGRDGRPRALPDWLSAEGRSAQPG